MYKIMLVDDERSIRNLLKNIILQENLEVEIAGEAESGVEAVNTMDRIKPNIMFIDIKMPFMDGIELAKIVTELYPKIKIIILTAFSEFEYAQACIDIGICKYLLKPIVRLEVRETLEKIIKDLNLQKDLYPSEECHKKIYKNNETIHKIQLFIEKNYEKANLNLKLIAKIFSFNACYLSRMYKEETKCNISDYILECRMNKAIECAQEGKLMYVTATSVGIPDPNYFGKCFKKFTNKNYSEFVKQLNIT